MKRFLAFAGALAVAGCVPTQERIDAVEHAKQSSTLTPMLARAMAQAVTRDYLGKLFGKKPKIASARISGTLTNDSALSSPDSIQGYYCIQIEIELPLINHFEKYIVYPKQTGAASYELQVRGHAYGIRQCENVPASAYYPYPELEAALRSEMATY